MKSCSSIPDLGAKHGVDMPITDGVRRVCHDGLDPRAMAAELLGRAQKAERQ